MGRADKWKAAVAQRAAGAVAVAAGIIALEPAFATGAALGVVLVAIGHPFA